MRKDKKLFLILSIVMGVVVISSNYLVQFPVNFFNLESILTYGAFSYPVAFLITDLANRAYGKNSSKKNCSYRLFPWYFSNSICINKLR